MRKPGRKPEAARLALESTPGCPPPLGSTHGTPRKGRARSPNPAAAAAGQHADAALNPSPAPDPDPRPAATPRGRGRGRGRPAGPSAAADHATEGVSSPAAAAAAAAGAHAQAAGRIARGGRRGRWGACAGAAVVAAAVVSARRRNPGRGSSGVSAAQTPAPAAGGTLPGRAADPEPQPQAASAGRNAPQEAKAAAPAAPSAVQLRSGRHVPRAAAVPGPAVEPAEPSRAAAEPPTQQRSDGTVLPGAAGPEPAKASAVGSETMEPPRKRPRTEAACGMRGNSLEPAEAAPAPAPPPEPSSEPALGPRARRAPAKWSPAAKQRAPKSECAQRSRAKRAPGEQCPGSAVAKRSRPQAGSGAMPGARLPELGPRPRRTPSRWSPGAFERRGRRLLEAPGAAQGGHASGAAPGAAGSPEASPLPAPESGLGSPARRRAAAARECTPFSPSVSVTEDLHGRHLVDNPDPSPGQGSLPRPAGGQGLGSGSAGAAAEPAAECGALRSAMDTADSDPGQSSMLHPADGRGAGHGRSATDAELAAGLCAEDPGLLAPRTAGSGASAGAAAEQVLEPAGGGTAEKPAAQQVAGPGPATAEMTVCELWGQEPAAAPAPGIALGAASGGLLGVQQGGATARGDAGDASMPSPLAHAPSGSSQGTRRDPDPSSAPEPSPGIAGACSAGPGGCGGVSAAAAAAMPAEQHASRAVSLPDAGEAAAGTEAVGARAPGAEPSAAADAAAPPNPGQGAGPGAHAAPADDPPAGPACRADRGADPPPDPATAPCSPAAGHGGSPAPAPCAAAAGGGSAPSVERPGEGSMPAGTGQPVATAAAAALDVCGINQGQGSELRDVSTDTALNEFLCPQQPARSPDQGQGSGSACPVTGAAHVATLSREEHGRSMQLCVGVAPPLADGDAGPVLGLGSPGLGSDAGVAPGPAAQGSVVLHAGIPSLLPALYDSDASPGPSPVSSPGPRQRSCARHEADPMPGTQAGAAVGQAVQAPASSTGGVVGEPGAWLHPSPARHRSGAAPPSSGCYIAFPWCDGAPALATASPVRALPRSAQSEPTASEPLVGDVRPESRPTEPEPDAEERFDASGLPAEDLGGCDWGDGGCWSPQPAAVLQVGALTYCSVPGTLASASWLQN